MTPYDVEALAAAMRPVGAHLNSRLPAIPKPARKGTAHSIAAIVRTWKKEN